MKATNKILSMNRGQVAQAFQPAVSPTFQSAAPVWTDGPQVGKPAVRQTGKSALQFRTGSWSRCAYPMMWRLSTIAIAACMIGSQALSNTATNQPPFRYIWGKAFHILPGTHNQESGYKSLCVGLNQKAYVGTAKYGENSYLVEFDPVTEKQRIVVDVHKVVGQTTTGYTAQAKLHTRNHVGPSGTIYVGSKQGYPSKRERDAVNIPPYPGGYVISYDPKTNKAKNLGMPWPGFGVIDTVADEARGLIYVVTCEAPYAWMVGDMKTKRYRWLGPELATNCQTLIDGRGRANALTWDFKLVRYDPDTNKLTTQPILLDGERLTRTRADTHTLPLWHIADDGKTAYMTIMNQAKLYRIDLGGEVTGPVTMTTVGTLVEGPKPDSRCALTIAPDGRVFAIVTVDNDTGFGARRLAKLAVYDPGTGECRELGVLAVKNPDFYAFDSGPDGKLPGHMRGFQTLPDDTLVPTNGFGLDAAADGTVYVTILYPFTLLRIDPGEVSR